MYLQHVGFIKRALENSLHRNGGVPLSVSLINMCFGQFVLNDSTNPLGKDSVSRPVTELTSISSVLLL